ncbi:hypothetical protein RB195_000304 [Necator americanus]|uniref:aECM cysteine-cradle domain-containing protein n=1 Tax=Necator americanus TaxID=51031 RepID=A0ABR1D9S6_NECAM
MGWKALMLFVVAVMVVVEFIEAAEEEHFIDVKQIVKGTIEAVAKLPMAQNDTEHNNEKNPEEFYKLFQLPADIMTKLAADAGYIEHPQTTTSGPWIVRKKVHRSSEGEGTFVQVDSDEEEDDQEEEEEKPRKRKKYYKKKDPTLIAISDLLPKSTPLPMVPLQPAPGTTSLTNPTNIRTLPIVQSATDLSHSNVQPQYAYQPIVQPDGKTYYQQVLILPGRVVSSRDALPMQARMDSPFIQEKPRNVVQADFTVAAPTFPPPVEVVRRNPQTVVPPPPSPPPPPPPPSTVQPVQVLPIAQTQQQMMHLETVTRNSVYPSRFIKPLIKPIESQQRESSARIPAPQNDPIAIPSSRQQLPTPFTTDRQYVQQQKESLYSTKLPSGEEQRINARVFHEEAAVPPKFFMKATQESPLRIRTIDNHLETATAAQMEQIRSLKRGMETKKVMEERRQEVEPQTQRKRKLRKVKKTRKLSKKNSHSRDVDSSSEFPSSEKTTEDIPKPIRRMPQTQFLERVPILTPHSLRKHERVYASKTWKKRRYEPIDIVVPKDLESFEDKGVEEEDVTEPPKKRRKLITKKTRIHPQNDPKDEKEIKDFQQRDPEQEYVTSAPLRRKILRLSKFKEDSDPKTMMENYERSGESRPVRSKKLKRTKRVKKMKSSTSRSETTTAFDAPLPHRQHCLNIRTFARQFGVNDVDEFARDHCAFIENYYPHLTCDRRPEYVAECLKYY